MNNINTLVISLTKDAWWAHYGYVLYKELTKYLKKSKVFTVVPKFWEYFHAYNSNSDFVVPLNGLFWIETPLTTIINLINYIKFIFLIKTNNIKEVFLASNSMITFLLLILSRLCGCKCYIILHDPLPHSWEVNWFKNTIMNYVKKLFVLFSHRVIVHGETLKKETITAYNINNEKKIIPIYHPNYNDIITNVIHSKPERNTFLFFGRILEYKWLEVLLEAISLVKKKFPAVKLLIAGSWDISRYEQKISSLWTTIELVNEYIPDEKISYYFSRSLSCILPYHDATATWVVPIAYACYRPVIVSNVWELPSVVVEWKTGFIVEVNDTKLLAKKMIRMLENYDKVIQLWKKWREYSEKSLSRNTQIDYIYKNIC